MVFLFFVSGVSANVILVTGQKVLYPGDKVTLEISTDAPTSFNISLLNSTGNVLRTLPPLNDSAMFACVISGSTECIPENFGSDGVITMLSDITINYTFVEKGNYTVIATNIANTSNTVTHTLSIIDPYSFRIQLLEADNHGASRNVIIQTTNALSVGTAYQIADTNVTKSGTIYYGNTTEAAFGCDLDGDSALTTVIHVWVTDPDTNNTYSQVFMDDDANIVEATETGKPAKTFLNLDASSVKCSNFTDLAPFAVGHVYKNGVYLILPPGPTDRPYAIGDNITFEVFAYNNSNGVPVSAGISALFRIKLPTPPTMPGMAPVVLWANWPLNNITARANGTQLDASTGANGKSNVVTFDTDLASLRAGEYSILVNDVATQTFGIKTAWEAKVIVGDPITGIDKYDFSVGDSVALGITTDAASPTITVSIYNPNGSLENSWSYNGTNYANGIGYDTAKAMYLAGLNSTLSPLLTATQTGTWTAKVVVRSGSDEKTINTEFRVKAFEVVVAPLAFYADKPEPDFGKFQPNGRGYLGIFTMRFGIRGDMRKNIEESDLIMVDTNYTDNTNECANAVRNLTITDSSGTSYPYSVINNIYIMLNGTNVMMPEQFKGQCMANFTVPATSGDYYANVVVNTSSGSASGSEKFTVSELDSWCEPWDIDRNNFRWHFALGSNVTLRIKVNNIYTGQEIDASNIISVELTEVFNPDGAGVITDTVEGYGYGASNLSGTMVPILWVKLSNSTSGFHDVGYRVKATINASGTLKNVTGTGRCGFQTRLYEIFGHPDFSLGRSYFRPEEPINFTVEVRSPDGPVSGANVYIEDVWKMGEMYVPGSLNFTATRGTTANGTGMASITISLTNGTWNIGNYDVRIRVKDSQNQVDYGHGWFEIKGFQIVAMQVEVNGSVCTEVSDSSDTITEDTYVAIYGVNQTGIFVVTLMKDKSHLFQFTNLNGEPVSRDIKPIPLTDSVNCTLSDNNNMSAKYFMLNTSGLGGEYDIEIVAQTASGAIGTATKYFSVKPFTLDLRLDIKGEPVYSKGDTLVFNVTTRSDYNITNASFTRLVQVGMGDKIIPVQSGQMTPVFTTAVGPSRKFNITIVQELPIMKGQYVIQIAITVTKPGGETATVVASQFFILKPFTYSLAMIQQGMSDTYSTSENKTFSFWDQWQGNAKYGPNEQRGTCPFPSVLNYTTEPCGLINITSIRGQFLELCMGEGCRNDDYDRFMNYYNQSGRNLTLFSGFYLIVGSLDSQKVSTAKVYVAYNTEQLSWTNLTSYSKNDLISDESGMVFRISDIRTNEITLTPVIFARSWNLRGGIKANLTNASLSGSVRIGVLQEENMPERWIDYNLNGQMDCCDYGLPFMLMDRTTPGVYDTALVDSDMDLDLTDETPLAIGSGTTLPLLGKKVFLIKADKYQTMFALNEPGMDNWMGMHQKGNNITVPIFSPTTGVNLSVRNIEDVFARSPLAISEYDAYPAVVGSDNLGFLKVNIRKAGHYIINYQITANGTVDIPDSWMSPFVEVKAFDSRFEMMSKVINIGSFSVLNASSVKLQGIGGEGGLTEWVGNNGTVLSQILATLPTNFNGFIETDRDIPFIGILNILYDNWGTSHALYISNGTNFTAVSGANEGVVAYSANVTFPGGGPGGESDTGQSVSVTFMSRRCWDTDCEIILELKQPNLTPIYRTTQDRCMSSGSTTLCNVEFDKDVMFGNYDQDRLIRIRNSSTGLDVLVDNDINNATADIALGINPATGLPTGTDTVTISKDLNDQWCWGGQGCPGGQYILRFKVFNVTRNPNPDADGPYTIWFAVAVTYNESVALGTRAQVGDTLIGPSNAYYVRYLPWKGQWFAIDVSNASNPTLYISADRNLSGEIGYHLGDMVPIYDSWSQSTVTYGLQCIGPQDYGNTTFALNETKTYCGGVYSVKLLSLNLQENETRFRFGSTKDSNDMLINVGEEDGGMSIKVRVYSINATHALVSVRNTEPTVSLGFNTDGLDNATKTMFTAQEYEKRVGSANLSGTTYIIFVLDVNSTWEGRDFRKVIFSNDTVLTADEVMDYGSGTSTNGYYISYLDRWGDRVVLAQNVTNIIGLPESRDNAGYRVATAAPSVFPYPMNNSNGVYTFILFDDNDRDGIAKLLQMKADDDNNWINDRCDGGGMGGFVCYDENPSTGAMLNESGMIAEQWGRIPELGSEEWLHFSARANTTSTFGGSQEKEFNFVIWDENISEPVRLFQRFEWWGGGLNKSSNITMAIKVRDFAGNTLVGATFNVTELVMMGDFGGEWMEVAASTYLNYTITYDRPSQTVDSDGIIVATLAVTNGTWLEKDYEMRFVITKGNDTERSGIWFHVGQFMQKDFGGGGGGGGGDQEKMDACKSIINKTICNNFTGKCQWQDGANQDPCGPAGGTQGVFCTDYTIQNDCVAPCFWVAQQNQCVSCNLIDQNNICTQTPVCSWDPGSPATSDCVYVGGGG